ncbi:hypothetical protein D3C85_1031500 [compost metagenome]
MVAPLAVVVPIFPEIVAVKLIASPKQTGALENALAANVPPEAITSANVGVEAPPPVQYAKGIPPIEISILLLQVPSPGVGNPPAPTSTTVLACKAKVTLFVNSIFANGLRLGVITIFGVLIVKTPLPEPPSKIKIPLIVTVPISVVVKLDVPIVIVCPD